MYSLQWSLLTRRHSLRRNLGLRSSNEYWSLRVRLLAPVRLDLAAGGSSITPSWTVDSEPDKRSGIVSTTCQGVATGRPSTKDSATPIKDKQVGPTLKATVLVLGSYVTCSGAGILSTLVVTVISCE